MPSGLMRKLNAMKTGAPKAPKTPDRPLVRRVFTCMADERLYHIRPEALRRIGHTGGAFDIEKALFLDTETTGLSGGAGTVAFLVGVGYIEKGRFTVEQLLMPTYAHEEEMLKRLSEIFSDKDTVIHFNGKSFDMPLLKSRFTINRMQDMLPEFNQLDLLHPSRRLWKLRLGSCRLSELEKSVLNIEREGDIPGAEVPQRYFDFLKAGGMTLLEDVIDHNRQDILTLSDLLIRLTDIYLHPERETDVLDQFSLGKAFEKLGEWEEAKKMYRVAAMPRAVVSAKQLKLSFCAGEANRRLYHIYRKNRKYEQAEEVLKNMVRRRQMEFCAKTELCKLYEHRMKREREALMICREMLKDCAPGEREAVEKRIKRLQNKLDGKD